MRQVTGGGKKRDLTRQRSRSPGEPMFNSLIIQDTFGEMEEKDIQKEILKPITKVNSKLDKELQEWEGESTKGGETLINKCVKKSPLKQMNRKS